MIISRDTNFLSMDQESNRWSYATMESTFSLGLGGEGNSQPVRPADAQMQQHTTGAPLSSIPSFRREDQYIPSGTMPASETSSTHSSMDEAIKNPFVTPPGTPRASVALSHVLKPQTIRSSMVSVETHNTTDKSEASAVVAEIVKSLAMQKKKAREELGGRLIPKSPDSEYTGDKP
jgi:hypothetical protein